MTTYNNFSNSRRLINSFNPQSIFKLINCKKNNNIYPSKVKKIIPLFCPQNKNSYSLKEKSINSELSKNFNNHKILENIDSNNDIKLKNYKNIYKTSLSCTNSNNNYYEKRRNDFNNYIKTIVSETSYSRNANNRNNGNSLSGTTWSSFSFTEGINSVNSLIHGNEYNYNNRNIKKNYKNKFQNIKNEKIKEFKISKFNRFDLKKLKESGIKFCIDEDGNPMNITDIKLKNKNPIAFIIHKLDKNILVDIDNRIINPNYNGDYNLPQKPYFTIRRYDVQFPELRVNNLIERKNTNFRKINNSYNKNYISIDVNETNKKAYNNIYNILNNENIRRQNNKSFNLYNFTNLEEPSDMYNNIENKENISQTINKSNNLNSSKMTSYKQFKNSLRENKRKYIFLNALKDNNKSMQLKIDINGDSNSNNNINNNFESIKSIIQFSNRLKKKDIDNNFLFNNIKNNHNSSADNNKKNHKIIIKNLNKYKNKTNKLKDIKCFTKKEIKNLEFNFERKYKSINIHNSIPSSFLSGLKYLRNRKNQKTNNILEKRDSEIEKNSILNNIEKRNNSKLKKRYLNQKTDNSELRAYRKKNSYSLNEFMLTSMEKQQNNYKKNHNMLNTLSTFNHSSISPPTETTSYATIQNIHGELDKTKRLSKEKSNNNNNNIKKYNGFKYYLKPKVSSKKIFHKRIKTEDINNGENRLKFFNSIKGKSKNILKGNLNKKIYHTLINFSLKNSQHNSYNNIEKINNNNNTDTNNNICKCPYCHHLFYG